MGNIKGEYFYYGMTGISVLMMLFGAFSMIHSGGDNDLGSVGDSIMGAVLTSGGFVGGCILWF